jgi:murein DD-endopeptidase MepM/ murein hydrolase activator NlpD
MAFAVIAGLDYDSPVVEFNVRPEPGTAPDVVVLKAQKGPTKFEILDVKPDNQGTKQPDGQVYQWFKLKFANGQTGWLRSHILTIEGDCTAFGYGMISTPTYAYKLNRVVAAAAPVPTIPAPAQPVTTPTAATPAAPAPAQPATPVTPAPAPAPTPATPAPVAPTPAAPPPNICAGTVTAARGANLRRAPVNGESIMIIPFEAIVTVQEIRSIPGEQFRWIRVTYEGTDGWAREDLFSYSGDGARFNLRVTSPIPARPVEVPEYTGTALYPVPMARFRFIRGFTGPQPSHPGVDYGADDGEPILAGPVGGLVVASKECVKCNVPGKPSTVLQGFSLGDERIFTDDGWNFGFGHYMIVCYMHKQLPPATRQALANRGMPGAHIFAMYAHLSRRDVPVGTLLQPNQVFAACGNTGNSSGAHLHLELRASSSAQFSSWAGIANGLIDPLVMFLR